MSKFKRDVVPLLDRSIASLTLAIELFNRPSEVARSHSVLMLLQHSFELLLKAAILQRTGRIREPSDRFTYSFDRCLQIAQGDLGLLSGDEKATLSILDAQRDQAQHFYVDVSEELLYVHAQSAVTLYSRLLHAAFSVSLARRLPSRVLPVSTKPPTDISLLLESELRAVDALLAHGTRKSAQAEARLRAVLAFAIGSRDTPERPAAADIHKAVSRRRRGRDWSVIFPEVARLRLSTEGGGIPVHMRISKDAPLAVRVARPGEEVVGTLVKQEINIWDKFNLSSSQLGEKLGCSGMRALALVYELGLQSDPECFHVLRRGKTVMKGYSKVALERLRAAVTAGQLETAWERHRTHLAGRRKKQA